MAERMSETIVQTRSEPSVEAVLSDELAQGDAVIGTIAPILRHLLANDDHSLFSDEIIARMRGMMRHLSTQLLDALDEAGADYPSREYDAAQLAPFTDALANHPALLAHLHALAVEWHQTERLQARLALDPVLSPLVQALVASRDPGTATLAMTLLAAQARFCQQQRRMELPLGELPGDLLHGALIAMRTLAGTEPEADARAASAEARIRAAYDEGAGRLALIARLVTGMGGSAVSALSVTHAGVAIFLSALSLGSGQDRDLCALSTNAAQLARFALALRASGLKPAGVEEQFLAIHPDVELPEGFDRLGADRAAAILSLGGFRG